MKKAKQAVAYYCMVTGKEWSDFYERLPYALDLKDNEIASADYELWLVRKLADEIEKSLPLNEFVANKDVIKSAFDNEGRKNSGEFFTPLIWCAEARKYFDKYIENWREEYNVWDASCYSMDTEILVKRTNNCDNMLDVEKLAVGFMGWVTYDNLLDTDLVWGYNPSTKEKGWVGFHSRFKKYDDLMYIFKDTRGRTLCKVTGDHKMLVYIDGKVKKDITAKELYLRILTKQYRLKGETVDDVCLVGDNTLIPLSFKDCKCITNHGHVWDITMDKWHYFMTRLPLSKGVFLSNCGTGNLMREAGFNTDRLFLSTLQDTDVDTVSKLKEYKGATVFQLDFLNTLDYDMYNTEFSDKLPPKLQKALRHNEKIIFYMNPPYKCVSNKSTEVGTHMANIGMSKPAYDIFYQFCWRIMRLVDLYDLTNAYYCFFGPLTFFTGSSANILFTEFEKHFEFIDGMCMAAQDFADTSDSIDWGIGFSVWKAHGSDGHNNQRKVILEKKVVGLNNTVETTGEFCLYTTPRQRMVDWLRPKDVLYYKDAPVATSHCTFKGSEEGVLEAPFKSKMAVNALGTIMTEVSFARSGAKSAIYSIPSSVSYESITEENFDRCIASYAFRNIHKPDWADAKRWLSAPDTSVEGYDTWLANALVFGLFELKSMQAGIRNLNWCGEIINVYNHLFPLTEEEIREHCTDELILQDLDKHGLHNDFVLSKIKLTQDFWKPEVKEYYKFCKELMLMSFDARHRVGYKYSTVACDAGFGQIRYALLDDNTKSNLFELLNKARNSVNKNLSKFGFLAENGGDL